MPRLLHLTLGKYAVSSALIALISAQSAVGLPIVYSNLAPDDQLADYGAVVFGAGDGLPPASKLATSFVAQSDFELAGVRMSLADAYFGFVNTSIVTAHVFEGTADMPVTLRGSAFISGIQQRPAFYTFFFEPGMSFSSGSVLWVALTNATGVVQWVANGNGIGGNQHSVYNTDLTSWNPISYAVPQQLSLEVYAAESVADSSSTASALAFALVLLGSIRRLQTRHG